MDIYKIQTEISFLKDRIIALDESIREHLRVTGQTDQRDQLIISFIEQNIDNWLLVKYIPTKTVINSLREFVGSPVTSYIFNYNLHAYCNEKNIGFRKDFSKRYSGKAKKSYYFYK